MSTFMSNLIQEQCAERGRSSRSILEVANDNAKTHLVNSRTIAMLLQDKNHNSSNRPQRSCRWGDTTRSPASVTDYIDISPTAFDKSSRSSSPSDHDPSPPSCSSRWDLDEDRFLLNSSSPTRPSRKLSSSRIAQLSSRKNLPPNLQTLPY
jgi:hypothetical protein